MRNGQRDQQRNFQSGLVRGQARKLVMLRLLRVKKRVVKRHQQMKKIMMKRKRRKRKKRKSKSYALDKSTFDLPTSLDLFPQEEEHNSFCSCAPDSSSTGKKIINTFLTCFHSEASPTDAQDYIGSSLLLW